MVLACCFSFYGELHKKAICTRDKGAVGNDINAIQAQESLKRIMEFLKLHPEQALAVHHAIGGWFLRWQGQHGAEGSLENVYVF